MESTQLHSSPHVRTQYLIALAALSDELNATWKRIWPADERWPRGTCEEFFEPFVKFGVALYNAYAQECLQSSPMPSLENYLHSLNFDLKTRVCTEIAPYRANRVRTLQDAIEADKRGEMPDEWTLRMGESWRMFDHPRHREVQVQAAVRREFLDPYDDELSGTRSRLVDRIHKAISLRVLHWLAAHAKIAEQAAAQPDGADVAPKTEPSPLGQTEPAAKARRGRGPKPDFETALRVAEVVTAVAGNGPWRSKLEEIRDELDRRGVPHPKKWRAEDHGDWLTREREYVVKAIEHHLTVAARHRETFS
jgi:hypothetical protein